MYLIRCFCFVLIIIISNNIYSDEILKEKIKIEEIIPSKPFIGTNINIKGNGFGNTENTFIFFNDTKLESDSLNIIEWNNDFIRLILPEMNTSSNLKMYRGGFISTKSFFTQKLCNIEYFNPVKYTLIYYIDINNIRITNSESGKIFIYIPQPVISEDLVSKNTLIIEPKPDYIQDNGILIYEVDPETQLNFKFKQVFEITTIYKNVSFDNTSDVFEYDRETEFYKYYTGEELPFIIPNHPKVKQKLKEIIGETNKSYLDKARLIYNWSVKRMTHTFTPEDRSPLYTMENGIGDCLSDAYLFATLARSAGIPVRFNSGYLFYHKEVVGGLHFWQDVFIPGTGWIPVDVSLGHSPSFLKYEGYETNKEFYFGGDDGRRMAFCKGRITLLRPDETGKLSFYMYQTQMQNPTVGSSNDKMKIYYTLKKKMDIQEIKPLYDDSADWFLKNNK